MATVSSPTFPQLIIAELVADIVGVPAEQIKEVSVTDLFFGDEGWGPFSRISGEVWYSPYGLSYDDIERFELNYTTGPSFAELQARATIRAVIDTQFTL